MFVKEMKDEVAIKLTDLLKARLNILLQDNWESLVFFGQCWRSSLAPRYIITFEDGTYIMEGELFCFSSERIGDRSFFNILVDNFLKVYKFKNKDNVHTLNILNIEIGKNGDSRYTYSEDLYGNYEYPHTPYILWSYVEVGNTKGFIREEEIEAEKYIDKYSLQPKRTLQRRIKTLKISALLENLLYKQIMYINGYLPTKTRKIYFHLDVLDKKWKLSLYINTADNKWIRIRNIQSTYNRCIYQELIVTLKGCIDEIDELHRICSKKYTAIDYVYDISTGELSYVYDNITEDNFTDELALVNAWEERYFSKDGEPLLTHAVAPHEECIAGAMHIDMSQFIEEEIEEMVSVDPAIEFTGEDIHDLIPQYLQNSYDILYSILPGTYQRVYLYVENDGTVCRQLGYIIVDGEYLTFEEMIDHKVVSQATYDATMEQLALWSNYMRNAFIACHLEPWTVFSYMIDEERHISTNFGYDVLAEQTYDNELFDLWSYEKLGIKSSNLPEDKIATIVSENEYAKF